MGCVGEKKTACCGELGASCVWCVLPFPCKTPADRYRIGKGKK